jgi:hypothetical protein
MEMDYRQLKEIAITPERRAHQEARKPIERDWQMITCLESGSGRGAKDSPADIAMSQASLPEIPAQLEAD